MSQKMKKHQPGEGSRTAWENKYGKCCVKGEVNGLKSNRK